MRRALSGITLALLGATAGLPAHAQADPVNGGKLFATHCAECHSLREGKEKKGPSLFRVLGRPAGTAAGFVYSDTLKAGGFAWTADNLDAYLSAPAKRVPGGKMKFDGLPSASERADLLAYLSGTTR